MTPGLLVLAGVAAGTAVALVLPVRPRVTAGTPAPQGGRPGAAASWGRRWRPVWAALGAVGGLSLLDGPAAWIGAAGAAAVTWWAAGRIEPPAVRAAREQARADLPLVVELLAAALRAGAATAPALRSVTAALPGQATERLRPVLARLELGADPASAWAVLAADPVLAPLGRALARAERSGAPVADAVSRLADELAARERAEVEQRARTVGVRAALPLGLLLLPAFLLLGIVPLVAAALQQVLR